MNKIFITGHKNIDVDSYISSVLLSKLMTFLKIENEVIILDKKLNKESIDILNYSGILDNYEVTYLQDESQLEGQNLFLVDHHETTIKANVLGCIDHHRTEKSFDYSFYDNSDSGSCALKIYKYMEQNNYAIGEEEIRYVIYSLLADTSCFRNTKTQIQDVNWVKEMCIKYSLSYSQIEKACILLTDLSNDIETITTNGLKEYIYNNKKVSSSYIQVMNLDENKKIEYQKHLEQKVSNSDIHLWVFIVYDFLLNKTYHFYIYKNNTYSLKSQKILSRGKDIMPKVEALISQRF